MEVGVVRDAGAVEGYWNWVRRVKARKYLAKLRDCGL